MSTIPFAPDTTVHPEVLPFFDHQIVGTWMEFEATLYGGLTDEE